MLSRRTDRSLAERRELRELQQISARSDRRVRERELDSRRQQEVEADAIRQRALRCAEEAALDWGLRRGEEADPVRRNQIRALQACAVDLAHVDPAITIEWLRPIERSTALVGYDNALAHSAAKAVICPPIIDVSTAVVVLHEIGHVRTKTLRDNRLQRECKAWRWAREHALTWDEIAQRRMCDSLKTYLKSAKREDILDVLEIEKLCSPLEFQRERQRRVELQIARDRQSI